MGFASRSSLQNTLGAGKGRLAGATTDSTNLPWEDCAAQINASQDWLLWHDWLDERLHALRSPGHGLAALAKEAAEQLSSDAFWRLVHSLTPGRRLRITPRDFWTLTMPELEALLRGALGQGAQPAPPLDRASLADLLARFPD